MKSFKYAIIVCLLILGGCETKKETTNEQIEVKQNREFYQLKTYYFDSKEQESKTDDYFRNSLIS